MFVSLPNSYVEILTPNVMASGGAVFERRLGLEARVLMNSISVLIKETPCRSLDLSPCENKMKRPKL